MSDSLIGAVITNVLKHNNGLYIELQSGHVISITPGFEQVDTKTYQAIIKTDVIPPAGN